MGRKYYRKVGEVAALVAALAGILTIPLLPRHAVVALAGLLGRLGYACMPGLRRVGRANLDAALGPALSPAAKDAILRQSFRTAALTLLDYLWFAWRTDGRLRAYVRFDPSFDACFAQAPLIGVSAHLGNWEALGEACAHHGHPFMSIAAPIRNRLLDGLLRTLRRRTGQPVVDRRGGLRFLLRVLKNGGRAGLLLDQNTVPRDGGIFVRFFGLPVPVSKVVHSLARHTSAKVSLIYCLADAGGFYTAYATPPVAAEDALDDETAMAQHITAETEAAIRRHPGQWVWTYKRWRYIPPGTGPAGYPFYAEPTPQPFLQRSADNAAAKPASRAETGGTAQNQPTPGTGSIP